MVERTLVLVKPNGVARGLIGEVIGRLERRGLEHQGRAHAHGQRGAGRADTTPSTWAKASTRTWSSFITSAPVFAMVVDGPSAVRVVRTMMGATNPLDAAPGHRPGRLRPGHGRRTSCTAPTASTSAEREIGLFFPPEDLVA